LKNNSVYTILLFTFLGFTTLMVGSLVQKLIISAAINLQGFIVPLIYGTAVGFLLGLYIFKNQRLYNILKSKNIELCNSEAELKASNEQLTENAQKLRKSNIDLIKAKEIAENSEKLKDDFIRNLNHEIRTPMNAIIGFSNLLEKNTQRAFDYTKIIKQSSFDLLRIIDAILEISLLNSNQLPPEFCDTEIEYLTNKISAAFIDEISQKGLRFEVIINLPENEQKIFTDADKVFRILSILIDNAIKFTSEGHIQLKIYKPDNTIAFCVNDTGTGIPIDELDKIFNNFYTGCNIQGGLKKGIGLGLSIATAYAKLLGSQIRVKSENGKGSQFCFQLLQKVNSPVEFNHQQSKAIKNIYTVGLEYEDFLYINELCLHACDKFKVLQIDDYKKVISSCGYNSNVAMIFINVEITKENAFDICSQIKEKCHLVPVIAVARIAIHENISKAWKVGFDEFLTIPFSYEEFTEIIQKYT